MADGWWFRLTHRRVLRAPVIVDWDLVARAGFAVAVSEACRAVVCEVRPEAVDRLGRAKPDYPVWLRKIKTHRSWADPGQVLEVELWRHWRSA